MKKDGVAVLFGDGTLLSNFIAIEDVAEFAVRILAREDIVDETIEIGGPSNISFDALVSLLETHAGMHVQRRRIPRAALWLGGLVLRPFHERAARLMRLGYFVATRDGRLLDWRVAADRFGMSPISVETFAERHLGQAGRRAAEPDPRSY
jgi:nucleoside-diphosphate-sugar epimerase